MSAEDADFETAIAQVVQLSSAPRFYSKVDIEQCLRDGHEGEPAGFALAAAAVAHQGSLAPAAPSVAKALAASFADRPSSRAVGAMCSIVDAMWSRGPVGAPLRIHPARVGVPPDSISRHGEIEHLHLSWDI